MKRSLTILCILVLLVTGCESKKDDKPSTTSSRTAITVSTSTSTSTTTTTTSSSTTKSTSSVTTTKKPTTTTKTTACRAKKFDKKYSYAYKTEAECMKQGNLAFLEISDNINSNVFSYSCRLIKDECGTEWYGAYFYVYNHDTNKEEEFNY